MRCFTGYTYLTQLFTELTAVKWRLKVQCYFDDHREFWLVGNNWIKEGDLNEQGYTYLVSF